MKKYFIYILIPIYLLMMWKFKDFGILITLVYVITIFAIYFDNFKSKLQNPKERTNAIVFTLIILIIGIIGYFI